MGTSKDQTGGSGNTGDHLSSGRYPTLGLKNMLREEVRPHERYAILGGFGLLVFLIYSLFNPTLVHPLYPTGALVFFLYPFSRGIVTRRLIQIGIATFLIWLATSLAGVLFPFIVAFLFSYLVSPLVAKLASKGIPRWSTSLAVVLLIVGVYSLVGFLLIPAFVGEFDQLLTSAQSLLGEADNVLERSTIAGYLTDAGLSESQANQVITDYVEPQMESLVQGAIGLFTGFLENLTGIVESLFGLILIPFLSFYMTVDFHRFRRFVKEKVFRNDPRYVYYLSNVDNIVNAYVRGILLTSSIVGASAIAILSLFGVPYALVLGVLTGLFNLIPSLGMFLNVLVGIIIFVLFPGDFLYNTLVLSLTILGLHAINAYMLEPRVLRDRVGVHPVLIIASLFIFAYFIGFIGLLIAVPVTAVVLMFLREWYANSVADRAEKTV